MENQRVAITGLGIVCSIGHNCEEFTSALKLGKSGIGWLENLNVPGLAVKFGAEIKDFSLRNHRLEDSYPEKLAKRVKSIMGRMPQMLESVVASSLEAAKSAGLHNGYTPSDRMSVLVAGSNLSQNLHYRNAARYNSSLEYISPSYALQFFDTNIVGILSELLNVHGEGYTVGGASASGNSALIQAYRMIKSGYADVCIVAAPMADFSPIELQAFYNLGAMGGNRFDNPQSSCRPFDKQHEGFILGQGSGCLILESMESAKRRNADILAEIIGGATVLDGNRLSDAREDGEAAAMKKALKDGNVSPCDIDYINAHGTSTPLGDDVELSAIRSVFKDEISRIWINSTKSLTGHCLFSAGIIEAIACIQQMNNGFIHPNLNLDNPIVSGFRFAGSEAVKADINTAMSNCFGFGGINTSIILKRPDRIDRTV
jgi:malonyl-ACP decarboxylase